MAEKKGQRTTMYCCVPQCNTYFTENVPFHTFPKTDKVLRAKWIHKLKIGKKVSQFMRVCGKHFKDEDYFFNKRVPCKVHRLKKKSVPSVNLPIGTHKLKHNDAVIQARSIRKENREKLRITNNVVQTTEEENELTTTSTILSHENDHNSYVEEDVAQVLLNFSKKEVIISKEKKFVEVGIQVNMYEEFNNKFDVSDTIDTDNKIRILTGIQNLALLNFLVQALTKLDKSRSKFDCRKLIILTLMRIKLDLPFTALSALFNISHTSAQSYFQRTVKNLARILRPTVRFPSREEIRNNMPRCFDKFPNTRIVLDCTEVEIQKSNCLKCRIRTYSFYKSKHTVKFLIGVAPSGLITFVSRAYGGRASDKAIFNKENLISKLSSGDAIMVDKGFLIDRECEENSLTLIRPPFLKKKRQLEKSDARKTAEIARARVHIERVIQRMKMFRIFRNVLPFKMLSQINNIVTIIVALTNLSKPVLSKEKFL